MSRKVTSTAPSGCWKRRLHSEAKSLSCAKNSGGLARRAAICSKDRSSSGLLEEVRRLTGSRDYLQAITRLQAGLMRFPEDPVLLQELGAAKSASELAERRAEVDARIAELEQLFRQGKAQEVKTGAGDLLQKYEEPRARELLAWANESLSKAKEIRRERTGRRRYPLWAGGLAAAVLSGGGLMFLLRPTVPPPPVTTPPNPQTTTQKPPVAPTSERSRHLPVTPDPGPTEPAPAKPKPKEPAAKFSRQPRFRRPTNGAHRSSRSPFSPCRHLRRRHPQTRQWKNPWVARIRIGEAWREGPSLLTLRFHRTAQ